MLPHAHPPIPLCILTAASQRRQATFALHAKPRPKWQISYELRQRAQADRAAGASADDAHWAIVEVEYLDAGELTPEERHLMDWHGWVVLHELVIGTSAATDGLMTPPDTLRHALLP